MEHKISHERYEAHRPFKQFTARLERALGRFDGTVMANAASDPKGVEYALEAQEGEEGMMLFGMQDQGEILTLVGAPRLAKQYMIGNPLVAMQMAKHDIRAALYAPLCVLIFEEGGKTFAEYDLPSSLFEQFGNEEVTVVARTLDEKILRLLEIAAE
jgi:uncharacterized protein (DUF302 family)